MEEAKRLANSEYWNERYTNVGPDGQVHEWFKSFTQLEPFLTQALFDVKAPETTPRILHLGSGDSTLPQDLAARGYRDQLCVDFSSVVVTTMSQRHADVQGIVWEQLDVRHMEGIRSGSVDVAFDKGTLDAMIYGSPWSPPDDVIQNTTRYIQEVFRVLKPDGIFLYVTYRQPHFVRPLLACENVDWEMDVNVLSEAGSFDYYGFVLRKATSIA